MADSDAAALAAGNLAYEQRFGYIYLICATGLSGEQMLAALRERLTHDDEQERLVVMDELRKIAALRLSKAVSGMTSDPRPSPGSAPTCWTPRSARPAGGIPAVLEQIAPDGIIGPRWGMGVPMPTAGSIS